MPLFLLFRKQKRGRNEVFRTHGQIIKYQEHTTFTGLPAVEIGAGGDGMNVGYLVSYSSEACLIRKNN